MKKALKSVLGILATVSLLFVLSCSEEFDVKNENDHQKNRNFEIKYKSFQQLMKEQKFNSAYKKVDQKIKTVKIASKTVMEEMYNFTIDTTVINEYHTSNYTSYNIGIIRDSLNNNYFENLFVEIDSSNVTTARILKYNINPISKLISSVETTPIIYNATSVTGKEAPGGEDCQTVSVYLQTQCGCPGHHWPGEGGCNCPNDPSTSTLLYSFTSCSSGGGGDVFDTGTLPSDPGTNILVTTTGGGSGSGSIAVPVVINYEKLRKNNLFKGTFFSMNERTWFFSQSEETQGAIMNYLESTLEDENGLILANVSEYSLEAKTFVKNAINIHLTTNIPVTNLIKLINDMDKECQAEIIFKAILSNSTFTNLIKDDLISQNDKHVQFSDVPNTELPNGAAASTFKDPLNDSIAGRINFIYFSNEYLTEATDLGIIVTTYHELLHAYIIDLYHEGTLLTNYPGYINLKVAMDNYYLNPNQTNADIFDDEIHNVFIDFIDVMGESIYNYCQNNNILNVDLNYSKKLVWGGLYGTTIFNTSLTQSQQIENQTIIAYEHHNYPNAKGSKSCN